MTATVARVGFWLGLGSLLGMLSLAELRAALPPETENLIPFKLVHTGNTQIRLEVCGCAAGMHGGVAGRSRILQEERRGVERFLLLDAGHLFQESEDVDRKIAEIYLETLALMDYDAVLVSETEFVFGADFLSEQIQKWSIPAVCTNIESPADATPAWKPILRFEFPRLRVAVIGLAQALPNRIPAPYQVSDPVEAASRAVQQIADSADLVIALSSLSFAEERRVLEQVKEMDLLLSSQQGNTFQRLYESWIARPTSGGKTINVIEATWKPAETILPFTFTCRSRAVIPDQGVDPLVRQVVDDFYQSYRQELFAASPVPRLFAEEAVEKLPGNEFVGSAECKECHALEHRHWELTKHSTAYLGLLNGNRHFVPQCLLCHTTGYGYPSGFNKVDPSSSLARVGCESCHGPGKLHVESARGNLPDKPAPKRWIRRKIENDKCKVCHDQKNDPQFDANVATRRQAVLHRPSLQ